MNMGREMTDTEALEAAALAAANEHYVLILFVSGTTPNSVRAIANTRQMCDQRLPGRHTLTIVDLYQQPELASSEQILAAPTLLRKLPKPTRRLVGNMADVEHILHPLHRPMP